MSERPAMPRQPLPDDERTQRRNRFVAFGATVVVAGMIGLAFAAVPLYRIFCQVTGYGGTTQNAESAPTAVGERMITVRFNADTAAGMPWHFRPEQLEVKLKVGEEALVFYRASNPTDRRITGTATFNVTPLKAGSYFNKIECFCFTEQTLEPGGTADMPVSFFVDPEIEQDPNLRDVRTITLSYTFFETKEASPGKPGGGSGSGS